MMKILVWTAAVAAVGLAGGSWESQAAEPVLWRAHFAGAQAMQRMSGGSRWAKIEVLPATEQWREQTILKLSQQAPALFNFNAPSNAAALLEPLIRDWHQFGGVVEVAGHGPRRQALVALKLPEARREAWQTAAEQLKAGAGHRLVQAQEGPWTLVAAGENAAALLRQWQTQIKAGKAPALPADIWLQTRLNGRELAPLLGLPSASDWPDAELECSIKGEDVRVNGTLTYAKAVNWRPDPWRIPRQTIREPLVSFTAANGVAPWFSSAGWMKGLGLQPVPNQVFGWSQGGMPLLVYAAAAVNQATGTVTSLAGKLPPVVQELTGQRKTGDFYWISNRAELLWQGLPLMTPFVKAVREPAGEFLTVQLFPSAPVATNPPPELFAQVANRPNLVYYSWEITEARVASWRQVLQLLPLFAEVRQVPADQPGQKWLLAAAPLLGNTVTEITFVSPQKMAFTRRGPVGLTGLELNLLSRGLDLWGMPPDFGKLKRPPAQAPAKP